MYRRYYVWNIWHMYSQWWLLRGKKSFVAENLLYWTELLCSLYAYSMKLYFQARKPGVEFFCCFNKYRETYYDSTKTKTFYFVYSRKALTVTNISKHFFMHLNLILTYSGSYSLGKILPHPPKKESVFALSTGLRICCILCGWIIPCKGFPKYDTILLLLVSLQFWSPKKYKAPLQCLYSQVTLTWSGSTC